MRTSRTKFCQQMTVANWKDRMADVDAANKFLKGHKIEKEIVQQPTCLLFLTNTQIKNFLKR